MKAFLRLVPLCGVLGAMVSPELACQAKDRDFSDAEASSGGTGGDGGMEGGGGTTVGMACTNDETCIDEFVCNGVEFCDDGSCEAGTPVECEAPSDDDCRADCMETAGGHECVVVAADADDDGFGSDACEEAPGDDCDDSVEAVNPEAEEVCDGIDNDCDSLVDLDDGLTLGGSAQVFVELDTGIGYGADVAFTPSGERFGLVYVDADGTDRLVRLRLLNPDGSFNAVVTDVDDAEIGTDFEVGEPSIHWGSDAFGLSWVHRDAAAGENTIHFATVQSNGSYNGQAVPVRIAEDAEAPRVGRFGGGDWFVVWIAFNEDIFSLAGEVAVPPPFQAGPNAPVVIAGGSGPPSEPTNIDVASLDDELGAIVDTNDSGVSLTRYDSDLEALASGSYPLSNNQAITATSDGYAATWPTASGIAIQRRTAADPSVNACSNENVDFGTTADPGDAVDIVATPDGMVVLATKPATDEIAIFVFDDDCEVVLGPISVSDSASEPTMPRLAVGTSGYAAVWRESPTGDMHQGFQRTFGPNLCG